MQSPDILTRALRELLSHIKSKTYSKTKEELWFEEWRNPIVEEVEIGNPETFLSKLHLSESVSEEYVLRYRRS